MALAWLLLAVLPQPSLGWRIDRCERLEENHFYNDNCDLVFTQIIGWDRGRVFFWRLKRSDDLSVQRVGVGYVLRWNDSGVFREVWASSFDESWTQYDPETADREFLEPDKRRKLK